MEQTPSAAGRTPELPSVSLSPERAPSAIEAIGDRAPEKQEQQHEGAPRAEQVASAPQLTAPALANPTTDGTAADGVSIVNSPTIASDDDLIEKEWVVKAKKVLAETKDDPYRREQEVNRLQADYLQKRYGRELGSSQ